MKSSFTAALDPPVVAHSGENAAIAEKWNSILRDALLPYWLRATVTSAAGYRIFDNGQSWANNGLSPRAWIRSLREWRDSRDLSHVRVLVSQARLLWVFSVAHRLGYGTAKHDYVSAATHGYRYLTTTMLDRERGGFYWKTHDKRGVIEPLKILYGQGFAIYALVEYHRATGLAEPLDLALSTYRTVHEACHDDINKGWIEHCDVDFKPLAGVGQQLGGVPDVVGYKSGDANLHWMEALIELYVATDDRSVRDSLIESLEIVKTRFYVPDAGIFRELRQGNWSEVPDVEAGRVTSYGHVVEFAWLMLHAERALGMSPSWSHFEALLERALKRGFDHERGGFYFKGSGDEPAFDTDKVWWVQAEGLAALTEAVNHYQTQEYQTALRSLIDWILGHQVKSADGMWIWSTDAVGRPKNLMKAGAWKAAYHEVRAITRFIAAFGRKQATTSLAEQEYGD